MMTTPEFLYVYMLFLYVRDAKRGDILTVRLSFTGCKDICGWEEDHGSSWAPHKYPIC